MFGKRSLGDAPNATPAAPAAAPTPALARVQAAVGPKPAAAPRPAPAPTARTPAPAPRPAAPAAAAPPPRAPDPSEQPEYRSEAYYRVKSTIFNALIETIDLTQLAQLDPESARDEIRDIVAEIISIKNVVMSIAEQEALLDDICNDVLGYGPLEPLLARDDIADVMVNGANAVFIEVSGKISKTGIRFRDNGQLMNICQRIVSQVGRRVDESSPICDARLPDGSRVNVIVPPLAIDGPTLTIRKFKKDKLKLSNLVEFGSISRARKILQIIGLPLQRVDLGRHGLGQDDAAEHAHRLHRSD
ncbi:MAG: ATPase, T2SS/T4P/T4SS family [Hyphomonadaceae bacterium]